MGSNQYEFLHLMHQLDSYSNVPKGLIYSLRSYSFILYQSDLQNQYNEPMPWIGMYIASASMFCILAMVADLLHGLRNKKLWFPCKYFTLNAASLTIIAVAMKLPMDLNNSMPGRVDQAAKLGSMGFMSVMMSNLLPALATMNNEELVTNIIALVLLVITLVVNVCIQITTGVVSGSEFEHFVSGNRYSNPESYYNRSIAMIYVTMLLILLMVHISSSLAILKSKQIIEMKYQATHETALKDQEVQQSRRLSNVKKLKQHLRNYWIMAGTGNPQFMISCLATTSASGVICAFSTLLHVVVMLMTFGNLWDCKSDYKWSMLVILLIQFIGSVVGTIAPVSRCFAALSFKLSLKWIWNNMKVFKVESYWTQRLSDLKLGSIPFRCNRRSKLVVQNLKVVIINFCIGFQKAVVIACKIIGLIPIFIVICVFNCSYCWKWLKSMFNVFEIPWLEKHEYQDKNENDSHYVLQLQEDLELAESTMKRISNTFDRLIKKAENQEPYNLMKFLEGCIGFGGVEKFDIYHVHPLLLEELVNCWGLPLVTLTTIAISLPNIQKNKVDSLMAGVSEGLVYVTLVEETINATDDHVRNQKAAQTLWVEVEVYHKWLGNKLKRPAHEVYTGGQILQWLRDTSKKIITEVESMETRGQIDNSKFRSICANSMYRITKTILVSYQAGIDQVSQEDIFEEISMMIADLLVASLTNLPQVIVMKCHSTEIEKREASVYASIQLLGETMHMMNILQNRELPKLESRRVGIHF
ncbi:hypothetical protein LXL04_004657 [Taraxacum kok-saghyz]